MDEVKIGGGENLKIKISELRRHFISEPFYKTSLS